MLIKNSVLAKLAVNIVPPTISSFINIVSIGDIRPNHVIKKMSDNMSNLIVRFIL